MKPFIGFAVLMIIVALVTVIWPLLHRRRRVAVSWRAIALVGLVLPAVAATLYGSLSNWPWNEQPASAAVPAEVEQMVRNLEARLQSNPMDVSGWLMLGRSKFQLEKYAASADAFRRAYTLTQGKNVEAVMGLGEAMAFADQNALLGQSSVLFDQAYQLAPNHPKVLWYTGLIAFETGRLEVARERWAKLVALNPPAHVKRLLQDKVIEIEAELVRAREIAKNAPPVLVKVRVSIAPELAKQAPSDAPLFVLVRTGEGGGPPLAVTRRTAGELPALIELSDKDAMIAGRGLSGAGRVTVLARVARSGQPAARSGDLEGRVSYDVGNPAPVDLVINSIVP